MTSFTEIQHDGRLRALQNCAAPAKLNLFLHVTGRKPDGYHLLQSVFQLIDWSDSLDFTVRDDGRVVRISELAGVPAEADLCVRAARLLQQVSGCLFGVDITVRKALPMGGGLGGGSSDAATTLLALNRLWQLHWPRERLMELGLRLGADVPFFVFGRNAWAAGVGEQLQTIELPGRWFAVIVPPVEVPTAAIFSDPQLTRDTIVSTIADFLEQPDPFAFGHNDLQDVATGKYAEVEQALRWLKNFDPHARMTGSGACVFASFENETAARQALRDLPQGMRGQLAKGLAGHPLLDLA